MSREISLDDYAKFKDPRSVRVKETTFDRVICHTSCAPKQPSEMDMRTEEWELFFCSVQNMDMEG